MQFYKALRKQLFQRDGGAMAAIRAMWSNTPWKMDANFPPQLFCTGKCRLGNSLKRIY